MCTSMSLDEFHPTATHPGLPISEYLGLTSRELHIFIGKQLNTNANIFVILLVNHKSHRPGYWAGDQIQARDKHKLANISTKALWKLGDETS